MRPPPVGDVLWVLVVGRNRSSGYHLHPLRCCIHGIFADRTVGFDRPPLPPPPERQSSRQSKHHSKAVQSVESLSVRLFRPYPFACFVHIWCSPVHCCPKPCAPSRTLFPRRLFSQQPPKDRKTDSRTSTDKNTDNALFNCRQAWQGSRRGPVEFALPIGQAAGTSRLCFFSFLFLFVCLSVRLLTQPGPESLPRPAEVRRRPGKDGCETEPAGGRGRAW